MLISLTSYRTLCYCPIYHHFCIINNQTVFEMRLPITWVRPKILNAQTIKQLSMHRISSCLEACWTLCYSFLFVYTHDCDKKQAYPKIWGTYFNLCTFYSLSSPRVLRAVKFGDIFVSPGCHHGSAPDLAGRICIQRRTSSMQAHAIDLSCDCHKITWSYRGAGLVCGRGLFEWHARNLKNIRAKITAKCRKFIVTFRKLVSQFWTLVQLYKGKGSNLRGFQGVLSRSLSSGENRNYFSINQACRAAVSWKPSAKLSKMAVVSQVGITVCWSVRY